MKLSTKVLNQLYTFLLVALTVFGLIFFIWLMWNLISAALPSINFYKLSFIWQIKWNPVNDEFGAATFIIGTLLTSFLALIFCIPQCILAAILVNEYLPHKLKIYFSFFVEMMAAIPSIIYGLWGMYFLIPLLKELNPSMSIGLGILPTAIILSIMITPTITSLIRSIFQSIERDQKLAYLAIGCTKMEAIYWGIIRPSFSGIVSAIFLGLSRAMGETMAVTMLIGNNPLMPKNIYSTASTISSIIANEYTDASPGLHSSSLAYLAVILILITLSTHNFSKLLMRKKKNYAKN